MDLKIAGHINEDGHLKIYDQDTLRRWINAHRGKPVELTIKLQKPKRSNPLNNYYWGVVISKLKDRMNELGNDFDENEVHDLMKNMFNTKEVHGIGDLYLEVPGSTAKMDNQEFMDYLERCKQFGAQMLGIYIPDPNESQLNIDNQIKK